MFSSNSKVESLADLAREVRGYVDARYRLLRLDFVVKLSALLSALVLGIVFAILIAVALLFLTYTLALTLAPHVGGVHVACLIVAIACLVVCGIVYALRKRLIVAPLTAFVAHVLLDNEPSDDADEANDKEEQL